MENQSPPGGLTTNALKNPWYNGAFFPDPSETHELEREDAAAMELCLMCSNQGTQNCSRCKARYCSQACQEKDWPMHELICKPLAQKFYTSARPENHHRALLLSQNEALPRFVWVPGKTAGAVLHAVDDLILGDSACQPWQQDSSTSFKAISTSFEAISINSCIPNRRCGRGLSFNVISRMRLSTTKAPDIKLNQCIARLAPAGYTDTQYGSALVWAYKHIPGPIAEDIHPEDAGKAHYEPLDFGPRDFRSLVDFLHSQKPNPCVIDPERFTLYSDSPIISAIKVNCDADVQRFRPFLAEGGGATTTTTTELPRFESVLVPQHVPAMVPRAVTWAELLGLSWVIRLVPSNVDLGDEQLANFHARFLGPVSKVVGGFGPHPIAYATTESMGSLLVMRKDGGSIHRLHVNWLTSYCEEITKENGLRLFDLCAMMARGEKVTDSWGDLKLNWLNFLKKKYKKSDGRVVSPWERIVKEH